MANLRARPLQVCDPDTFMVLDCPLSTSPVNNRAFPNLIDATTEELSIGLESGQFNSVDLVKV